MRLYDFYGPIVPDIRTNYSILFYCCMQKNIVHRDLKLGNMVLDKQRRRVTLTNFCLGKHLIREMDPLKDQRGSPAYISPDVLSGRLVFGLCVTVDSCYF